MDRPKEQKDLCSVVNFPTTRLIFWFQKDRKVVLRRALRISLSFCDRDQLALRDDQVVLDDAEKP